MSGKEGPETKLIKEMRADGNAEYGERLVLTKYHGGMYGEDGVSDLLGTLDGVMIACEVKHPKHYSNSIDKAVLRGPTLKQKAYIRRINKAGGIGAVAASRDQFMAVLAVAAHLARTGERVTLPWMDEVLHLDIICTCLPEGQCDFVINQIEGCFYCRTADPDLPCPNNPE